LKFGSRQKREKNNTLGKELATGMEGERVWLVKSCGGLFSPKLFSATFFKEDRIISGGKCQRSRVLSKEKENVAKKRG